MESTKDLVTSDNCSSRSTTLSGLISSCSPSKTSGLLGVNLIVALDSTDVSSNSFNLNASNRYSLSKSATLFSVWNNFQSLDIAISLASISDVPTLTLKELYRAFKGLKLILRRVSSGIRALITSVTSSIVFDTKLTDGLDCFLLIPISNAQCASG